MVKPNEQKELLYIEEDVPWGLKYIPRYRLAAWNDSDKHPMRKLRLRRNIRPNYTIANQTLLREELDKLIHADKLNVILEIGVNNFHKNENSSTIIKKKKPKDAIYLGVDIEDRTDFADPNNNFFVITCDSSEIELVMNRLRELGVSEIDFIHVDGIHSINQVLKEWAYAQYLSEHGVIMFHDTNEHPGPRHIFDAIDEELFEKRKYFTETRSDWGMAVAIKR